MSQIEHTLRMATLEAKEKDLRTIVIDGFAQVREQLNAHEEQIDTLAIEVQSLRTEMHKGFDRVDNRIDRLEKKMDSKFDAVHGKLDLILNALALT